ncbi:MAG: imelysin family protein [Gammaproteobacteria bacterium]|nr:imelysin family protein [Gammaproteobacteria bacterium]
MPSYLNLGLYLQKTGIAILLALLLVGCSDDMPEPQSIVVAKESIPSAFELLNPQLSASAKEIALNYVEQISTDLEQAGIEIEKFQSSIITLTKQTSSENLSLSRQAWLDTHSAYELTTLHRYFAAQLLEEQNSLALMQLQYQINHWPIIPGYIDYVDGYPDSGIVHDINVILDSDSLREQHGSFTVSEVTLGFHVIEFLLWGFSTDSDIRSTADYLARKELTPEEIENGYTLAQLSNNRRRLFLSVITDALVEDFQALQSLWLAEAPAIKQRIESTSGTEIIVILADSMSAMLTEELLLRSLYPMLNGDFIKSIQSPYSQSTQNAVSSQLSGLERLLLELQSENGTSLDLVFSTISDEFSEFFYQNFDASKSCLVLLYSNTESDSADPANERETEIVECINLLTNIIDYNDRLKFDLTN